jgi:hypothetical protein
MSEYRLRPREKKPHGCVIIATWMAGGFLAWALLYSLLILIANLIH